MTSKAYMVTWLGKGNINWTPLEQTGNSFNIAPGFEGPLKSAMDLASQNSKAIASIQKVLDPTLSKVNEMNNMLTLTRNMMAVNLGLSVCTMALTYKNHLQLKEIDRNVKELKGKMELLFLDNSLEYFIHNHQNAVGIIQSVLNALERDVYKGIQEIVNNSKLVMPSYLEHKTITLGHALKAWNELVYLIIHNGQIHKVSSESIDQWISKHKNMAARSPEGGYVDQGLVVNRWKDFIVNEEGSRPFFSSDNRTLMEKAISKENLERSASLIEFAREIEYCSRLNHSLSDKLEQSNEKILLFKAA